MGGWKTWAAGIGGIATGVSMVAEGLLAEVVDGNKIRDGVFAIVLGLGVLGIGHKIEKAGKKEGV